MSTFNRQLSIFKIYLSHENCSLTTESKHHHRNAYACLCAASGSSCWIMDWNLNITQQPAFGIHKRMTGRKGVIAFG